MTEAQFLNRRFLLTLILSFLLVLIAFDLWKDWQNGASVLHLTSEFVGTGLILVALGSLWIQNTSLKERVKHLGRDLQSAQEDALRWKTENAHFLKGLGAAIQSQMHEWSFTPAESEIALLLLKGLSLKEIAEIRATSERTVRQQTTTLYQKSGLSGRAELSAYFLEDLLVPVNALTRPPE